MVWCVLKVKWIKSCSKAGTEKGLVHVGHLPCAILHEIHLETLCNPRTILHWAHFSAHFIPIWAPPTDWVLAITRLRNCQCHGIHTLPENKHTDIIIPWVFCKPSRFEKHHIQCLTLDMIVQLRHVCLFFYFCVCGGTWVETLLFAGLSHVACLGLGHISWSRGPHQFCQQRVDAYLKTICMCAVNRLISLSFLSLEHWMWQMFLSFFCQFCSTCWKPCVGLKICWASVHCKKIFSWFVITTFFLLSNQLR